MSETNVNTNLANDETDTPAPHYITLPFTSCDVPSNSPSWFLNGFAGWINSKCDDALYQLRRLSFCQDETDIAAIYAAQRADITRENSPFAEDTSGFINLAFVPGIDVERLEEFFFFHLEKAGYEHTLARLNFSHEMVLHYVEERHFDEERQEQFKVLFIEHLESQGEWYQAKWRASGMSVQDLIDALLRGDQASPWFGDSAPESRQDWVREFEEWLADKGFKPSNFPQIPRVGSEREELAQSEARLSKVPALLLLTDDGDGAVRFVCPDPRSFEKWGSTSGYWRSFLSTSERAEVWEAWLASERAKEAA